MFEYDHSKLSLVELHKIGVRSTLEIEEVIEGNSFASEEYIEELGHSIIRFVGFTNHTRALKIVCRLLDDGRLSTLDTRIPTVEEIIQDFCKYC